MTLRRRQFWTTRALQWISKAEEHEHTHLVCHSFMRLKIDLAQSRVEEAVKQIQSMMSCQDFKPGMLQLACQEAVSSGKYRVAKEALTHLHRIVVAERETDAAEQGDSEMAVKRTEHSGKLQNCLSEAAIMRSLISCTMEGANRQYVQAAGLRTAGEHADRCGDEGEAGSPADSVEGQGSGKHTVHEELAKHYTLAARRVGDIGYQEFSKESRSLELDWMICSSWNAAIRASEAKEYQPCAVLFSACATFLQAHPQRDPERLRRRKVAHLMAAAAALEVHASLPTHGASIGLAEKMLHEGSLLAQELKAMTSQDGRKSCDGDAVENDCDALISFLEFEVATRLKETERQLQLIERCKMLQSVTADQLLRMAQACRGNRESTDAAVAAYHACLERLLSQAAPNYDTVSMVIRALIQLNSLDVEKLRMYSEARQLLVGLPKDAYPKRELLWLASTCWNRGCHHAKFCRLGLSLQYLGLGLELATMCNDLDSQRREMEAEVRRMGERLRGNREGEAGGMQGER
eukprot:evm.model.scf_131.19 EVM.evm.TU.scf_131.19   scf_131:114761-123418(-)